VVVLFPPPPPPPPPPAPRRELPTVLHVADLTTRYGAITALRAVSIEVSAGEVVALIGPNGAGKTTLLGSIAGLLRPAAGTVRFKDREVTGASPDRMLRAGMALVPEHRRIFADLTVEENLVVAGVTMRASARRRRIDELAERFPVLAEKRALHAGYLSGGQAQQLAIARALLTDPDLLLMDEPSLGLAPTLVDSVFDLIGELREQGRTMLIVEQNAQRALEVADRAYVLRSGAIVDHGPAAELRGRTDIFDTYLGAQGGTAAGPPPAGGGVAGEPGTPSGEGGPA
jgi:branched-chain amino acid transport system ATP-binding protein